MATKATLRTYVTSRDIQTTAFGYELTIPEGTPVDNKACDGPELGVFFIRNVSLLAPMLNRVTGDSITQAEYRAYKSSPDYVQHKDNYVTNTAFIHDATHYGIRVNPKDLVVPKTSTYYREDALELHDQFYGKDVYIVSCMDDFSIYLQEATVAGLSCMVTPNIDFDDRSKGVAYCVKDSAQVYYGSYNKLASTKEFNLEDAFVASSKGVYGYAIILKSDYDSENGDWAFAIKERIRKIASKMLDTARSEADRLEKLLANIQ